MTNQQSSQVITSKTEKLDYKLFWNWDHSTNWCLNTIGRQNTGVGNLYTKVPGEFVRDAVRMIDWSAEHGIDAVGIVGLLRDSHGGLASAKKICGYARKRGVRVNLIAGLYSYGGIYYEGDSFLSLDRFLAKNPDCIAQDIDASPRYIQFAQPYGWKRQPMACSSNPKVHNFVLDTLAYLFMALPELGGIQMETGDCTPVCMCDACRARRAEMRGGEGRIPNLSLSDMAGIYPEAATVIRSVSKDAWIICEMYTHFLNNPAFNEPELPAMQKLLEMPDDIFWQWSDRHLKPNQWQNSDRLPESLRKFRHIMRAHHGTQWDGGRHTLVVEEIRKQCQLSFESGMQGVSIFGESSPFHTNTEFNYLALQYFADHPMDSLHDFAKNVMASRLGGTALAETYLEFGVFHKNPEKIPVAVKEIAKIIPGIKDSDALRRWCYLVSFLNSFHWESIQSDNEKNGTKVNLDML